MAEQRDLTQTSPHVGFSRGVVFALAAAVFFGASTPLAKALLGTVDPVLLAGLFYLGAGIGLTLWWRLRFWLSTSGSREAPLMRADFPWLTGAVFTGGVVGPILLMIGLATTPASSASLLLNLEGVFTAILAWSVFHEHYDRRLVWGMAVIVVGGVVLSWGGQLQWGSSWGGVALSWAPVWLGELITT
jgi:drug/metabolite transporter (DMT)-like permease